MSMQKTLSLAFTSGQGGVLLRTLEIEEAVAEIAQTAWRTFSPTESNPGQALVVCWRPGIFDVPTPSKGGNAYLTWAKAWLTQRTFPSVKSSTGGVGEALPPVSVASTVFGLCELTELTHADLAPIRKAVAIVVCPQGVITNPLLIDATYRAIRAATARGVTVVFVVPPEAKLAPELMPIILDLRHDLPDDDALAKELGEIATLDGRTLANALPADTHHRVIASGRGLTRLAFAGAVSRVYRTAVMKTVDAGHPISEFLPFFDPDDVWVEKAKAATDDGLMTIHKETEGLAALAGIPFVKNELVPLIRKGSRPKLMVTGPPGTGKTQLAKRLSYDVGFPCVVANLDAMFQKWVGESEERTRRFFETVERMAPCVLVLDELPRYLATDNGPQVGNGVDAKIGAMWLQWLSSPKVHDIVIVATANGVSGVSTLLRAGRFDFVLYTAIERTAEQVEEVWDLYRKKLGIAAQAVPEIPRITPAEQEAICKRAVEFGESLRAAADRVTYVGDTQAAEIAEMETWGRTHCLNFDTGRRFRSKDTAGATVAGGGSRRKTVS